MSQTCPSCRKGRARRACPALGQQICTVCCGTKRLVEIQCPPDCVYLRSAQNHPPAAVQRQQERDLRFVLPLVEALNEPQLRLLVIVQTFLRSERPDTPHLRDNEVAEAARALAETYETASRGIIYEHKAASLNAQRLSTELQALFDAQEKEGLQIRDADRVTVMRRVERGAREAGAALPGGETAYLGLLKRILRDPRTAPSAPTEDQDNSRLIVPGR